MACAGPGGPAGGADGRPAPTSMTRGTPWTRDHRFLWYLVGILVVAVVAEGACLWRTHGRLARLEARAADLAVLPMIDKVDREATLLTVTGEEVGFHLRDLRAMENEAAGWIEAFSAEHDVHARTEDMLCALARNHIVHFGYVQVMLAVGQVDEGGGAEMLRANDAAFEHAVREMVDAETAEAFLDGFTRRWPSWVERYLRS